MSCTHDQRALRAGFFVDIDEAEKELNAAIDLLSPETRGGITERNIVSRFSTGLNVRSGEAETPVVHVFNFNDSLGFAILSGDRRIEPIICITEKGHLEPDSVIDNPGMVIFLSNMDTYYRIKTGLPVLDEDGNEIIIEDPTPQRFLPDTTSDIVVTYEYGPWTVASSVGTILPCQWGQGDPYGYCFNTECYTSDGQRAWAGCGPVAVGQIMYYWGKDYSDGQVSLDWDSMHTVYNQFDWTIIGRQKVGQLIHLLGSPSNMNATYGPVTDSTGTSTTLESIPQTFLNFGYSSGGVIQDYSFSAVSSGLFTGPVLGSGCSHKTIHRQYLLGLLVNSWETFSGGHAWVFDQAQVWQRTVTEYHDEIFDHSFSENDWVLHINWGWDGEYDGYFSAFDFNINLPKTRSVTEETIGIDGLYQFRLKVITGICAQ